MRYSLVVQRGRNSRVNGGFRGSRCSTVLRIISLDYKYVQYVKYDSMYSEYKMHCMSVRVVCMKCTVSIVYWCVW